MAGRGALRASDADREQVAERLRQALTEGRLRTEEFERRLESCLSARTYAELHAVLSDLPGRRLAAPRKARARTWVRPALLAGVAVPLAVVTVIAVVLAVTGLLAGWTVWVLAAWWFFGRRRLRPYGPRYLRSRGPCGGWHHSRGPARGDWA